MSKEWKPANMPTLVPLLPGGRRLIDFMTKVFEIEKVHVYEMQGGAVARAEIRMGDSMIMTGDPMNGHASPAGSALVYVADCDAAYERGLAAGAKSNDAPADQFYGDRVARLTDP